MSRMRESSKYDQDFLDELDGFITPGKGHTLNRLITANSIDDVWDAYIAGRNHK